MCYSKVREECQAFVLCCLGMLVIFSIESFALHVSPSAHLHSLECLYIPPVGSFLCRGDPTQTGRSVVRPNCAGNNLRATNRSYH